jgi:hypothetical protein
VIYQIITLFLLKDSLATVALPFHPQFDAGDHEQSAVRGGEYHPEILPFFGMLFECVLWVGPAIGFTFLVVYHPVFQYFPDLLFRNMPAIHPAAGMFGVDDTGRVAVNRTVSGSGLLTACKQKNQTN